MGKNDEGLDYFRYEVDSVRQQLSMTFLRDSTFNFTGSYAFLAEGRLRLSGVNEQDSVEMDLGFLPEFFRERK